jgi:hypothetical protein
VVAAGPQTSLTAPGDAEPSKEKSTACLSAASTSRFGIGTSPGRRLLGWRRLYLARPSQGAIEIVWPVHRDDREHDPDALARGLERGRGSGGSQLRRNVSRVRASPPRMAAT